MVYFHLVIREFTVEEEAGQKLEKIRRKKYSLSSLPAGSVFMNVPTA